MKISIFKSFETEIWKNQKQKILISGNFLPKFWSLLGTVSFSAVKLPDEYFGFGWQAKEVFMWNCVILVDSYDHRWLCLLDPALPELKKVFIYSLKLIVASRALERSRLVLEGLCRPLMVSILLAFWNPFIPSLAKHLTHIRFL